MLACKISLPWLSEITPEIELLSSRELNRFKVSNLNSECLATRTEQPEWARNNVPLFEMHFQKIFQYFHRKLASFPWKRFLVKLFYAMHRR